MIQKERLNNFMILIQFYLKKLCLFQIILNTVSALFLKLKYIIEDFENNFTKYQVFHKLSPSTLKYFNLLKGESYLDDFGNEFKCISHTIEY